jgi:methyl-galactoside transport system substrate-binding protein
LNLAVTADNYKDFLDSTVTYKPVSNQLDSAKHASKKVWLDTYNSADNFLGSTYLPLLQKYDKLMNLNVDYIAGDGQTESNITNRLGNPSEYDAFAINMVKTDNAASYTALLKVIRLIDPELISGDGINFPLILFIEIEQFVYSAQQKGYINDRKER